MLIAKIINKDLICDRLTIKDFSEDDLKAIIKLYKDDRLLNIFVSSISLSIHCFYESVEDFKEHIMSVDLIEVGDSIIHIEKKMSLNEVENIIIKYINKYQFEA